jgi:hypothetical protein
VAAAAWYRLAAEHGYARGAERLARLEQRLEPPARRRAEQLAAAWRRPGATPLAAADAAPPGQAPGAR